MPVRATRILSAVSASPWVPFNQYAAPFNVSFGVQVGTTIEASSTNYRIEHTFVNVLAGVVATANAIFIHEDVSANNANADGNYAFPIAAARLRVTAISAASATGGDIKAIFLQSGV